MKNVISCLLICLASAGLTMSCAYFKPIFQELFPESEKESMSNSGGNIEPIGSNRSHGQTHVDVSEYRNAGMDSKVKKIPSRIRKAIFKNPESVIFDLVDFFIKDEFDPFIRVKLIHDWIADNIAYDTASFFSGNIPGQEWQYTLRSRKSVCEGYSGLFKKMCDIAGIPCEKIHGYARGIRFDLFEPEDFSDSNHAWNAVNINGRWYLVDCTWDAGNVKGRVYRKDYSTEYLFLEPEYMIYTHYPLDTSWQLLNTPLEPEEVEALPKYRGSYFLTGLQPVSGLAKSNVVQDSFSFSIQIADDVKLSAYIVDDKGKMYKNYCLVQHKESEAEIMVKFPKPGKWELRLFAKKDETKKYKSIANVGFIAQKSSTGHFPVLYKSFIEGECYLYNPLDNPLVAGEKVEFKLKLPGYKSVYVRVNDNRYDLTPGADDVFSVEITVHKSSKLGIYGAKTAKARSYTGLIGYSVSR